MEFKLGQPLLVRFGNSATQKAVVEQLKPGKVGLRRYRANSGKWNKRIEWWDARALENDLKILDGIIHRREERKP